MTCIIRSQTYRMYPLSISRNVPFFCVQCTHIIYTQKRWSICWVIGCVVLGVLRKYKRNYHWQGQASNICSALTQLFFQYNIKIKWNTSKLFVCVHCTVYVLRFIAFYIFSLIHLCSLFFSKILLQSNKIFNES